jgi:hypothetical protein
MATPQEIGRSGLNVASGGIISEEFQPTLQGRQALLTYREMSNNDAVVGAILFAIDTLLRRVEWSVEQQEAKEEAKTFLEECMEDMSESWGDFISEALSMLVYGWAYHEIVYKKRSGPQKEGGKIPSSRFSDGKIGWRKMPLRSQDTLDHWEFDEVNGGLRAMVQKPPPDYEDKQIPIQKALLFRTSAFKNNPEGKSLLRTAYRAWFYKKRIEEIEGVGIERDLAGFPVITLPAEWMMPNAPDEVKTLVAHFESVGANIRRDKQEYLILPAMFDEAGNKLIDLTLLSAGGTRQFDTSAIIQRYNQAIASTVLADFILLGHEKVGSFALSSDKTDLFATALGSILDIIEDVLNRFAVTRLFALNGMDEQNLPKITHGDIEDRNLEELVSYVAGLVNAGAPLFPDEELEDWLRVQGHLPEKSEEAKQQQEEARQLQEQQMQQGLAGEAEGGEQPQPGEDQLGPGEQML